MRRRLVAAHCCQYSLFDYLALCVMADPLLNKENGFQMMLRILVVVMLTADKDHLLMKHVHGLKPEINEKHQLLFTSANLCRHRTSAFRLAALSESSISIPTVLTKN
jgi:hypothetical protein